MGPFDWLPHAPLEPLQLDWLNGVGLAVLRLDRIDPLISGNKWFKLTEHLAQARRAGATGVMSLGGAYSNHLHALAAAGKRFGFPTVGLLRGHPQDTPTVFDLKALGMQLHWLGYGGYRARHEAGFWLPWREQYPGFHPIPEGGGGLAGAEAGGHWVYGAMAVPDDHGVAQNVNAIVQDGYALLDASRGGFAKVDPLLLDFIERTEQACGLPLEPLYTGKALLALKQQVEAGRFTPGTRLIFIHTGGLQGRRGFL